MCSRSIPRRPGVLQGWQLPVTARPEGGGWQGAAPSKSCWGRDVEGQSKAKCLEVLGKPGHLLAAAGIPQTMLPLEYTKVHWARAEPRQYGLCGTLRSFCSSGTSLEQRDFIGVLRNDFSWRVRYGKCLSGFALFIPLEKSHNDVPGQFNPRKICQPDVFMFSVLCI